jgi:transposase InsO family protein
MATDWTIEKEERTANTGLAKVAVRASQTHLRLIKVWFSGSIFVVKIATFAKPENVIGKLSCSPNMHSLAQTDFKNNKLKIICRRELLNAYVFRNIKQVRILAEEWMTDYINNRPHKALNYLTPTEYENLAVIS